MKTIAICTFIIMTIFSPCIAMEQGQEIIEIPYNAVQSKRNYLKLSDGTHLTGLPENVSTALQNNDEKTRVFVSAINNELKKKSVGQKTNS